MSPHAKASDTCVWKVVVRARERVCWKKESLDKRLQHTPVLPEYKSCNKSQEHFTADKNDGNDVDDKIKTQDVGLPQSVIQEHDKGADVQNETLNQRSVLMSFVPLRAKEE
jgi:hypothetical protein